MEVPAEPQPPSEKVRRFDLLICSSFYYHSFLLVLKIFMKMLRGADERRVLENLEKYVDPY